MLAFQRIASDVAQSTTRHVRRHNPKPRTPFRARIVAQPGEGYPVGPLTRPRPR